MELNTSTRIIVFLALFAYWTVLIFRKEKFGKLERLMFSISITTIAYMGCKSFFGF